MKSDTIPIQTGHRSDGCRTVFRPKSDSFEGTIGTLSDMNRNWCPVSSESALACEWGPIRVFRTKAGHLEEATAERRLAGYTGWWTGLTTGDIDGDGRLDIVAGNWGLNSQYSATRERPLRLYYGDVGQRGAVDLIETEFDPKRSATVPRHRLDYMASSLPFLRERFAGSKAFSEATLDEMLGELRPRTRFVEVTTLASMVFFNRGDHFEARELPREAQFAPVFSVNVADVDGDGNEDIFLSQNFFNVQPEMHRLDAGRGLLLRGLGGGRLEAVPGQQSGIRIYGEQRGAAVADFNEDGRPDLAVTQNGTATKLLLNVGGQAGLRVRLVGPPGNPHGVGALLQLRFGERFGPVREVHAGSSYWSQDSVVQVMATPQPPTAIWVRWPGGAAKTNRVPENAREVRADMAGRLEIIGSPVSAPFVPHD